jgi:hypothetical protein
MLQLLFHTCYLYIQLLCPSFHSNPFDKDNEHDDGAANDDDDGGDECSEQQTKILLSLKALYELVSVVHCALLTICSCIVITMEAFRFLRATPSSIANGRCVLLIRPSARLAHCYSLPIQLVSTIVY